MAIERNREIEKQDIAASLVGGDGMIFKYCGGTGLSGEQSSAQFIRNETAFKEKIVNATPWADDVDISPGDVCELNPMPSSQDILRSIGLSATFEGLLSMMAAACFKASNVRYSNFSYLRRSGESSTRRVVSANVLLSDRAILSSNPAELDFANNVNLNSAAIVSSVDDFLRFGGIESGVMGLSASCVNHTIEISTVETLSSYCMSALNTIRTALSCRFTDENIVNGTFHLVYHGYGNGQTLSVNVAAYSTQTVGGYPQTWSVPSGKVFSGWSKTQGSEFVQYAPGSSILVNKVAVHLYPVFTPALVVVYEMTNGAAYFNRGTRSFSKTDTVALNANYTIQGLSYATGDTLKGAYTFRGWTATSESKVGYSAGQTIKSSTSKTIVLHPVVSSKSENPVCTIKGLSGEGVQIPNSGQTSLAWIVGEAKKRQALPETKYLVGIKILNEQRNKDNKIDSNDRVRAFIVFPNGSTQRLFDDRLGKTTVSTAWGVGVWCASAMYYPTAKVLASGNFSSTLIKQDWSVGDVVVQNNTASGYSEAQINNIKIYSTQHKAESSSKTTYKIFVKYLAYVDPNQSVTLTRIP